MSEERGMILAGSMGDVELTWDSQNDEQMRALIEKKMTEGMTFFVMKPLLGDHVQVRRKLKDMGDLRANSVKIKDGDVIDLAVKVKDADIEAVVAAGHARMFRSNVQIDATQPMAAVRVRDADGKLDHKAASKKAVRQRTIGVPALQGG